MIEILTDLDRWQQENEQTALATLVRVRGSAPRLPGARLCMTRSGRMAGSVSGGCVENDVFERAMQVLDSGQPAVASYGISDELGFEVGLSCGGSIDVLIEPFSTDEPWEALRQAVEGQRPAAFAIGLAPAALLGRKLAVLGDDDVVGSIDPDLDDQVAVDGRQLLLEGGTSFLTLPWRGEEASIFIELRMLMFHAGADVVAPWRVISRPLCRASPASILRENKWKCLGKCVMPQLSLKM